MQRIIFIDTETPRVGAGASDDVKRKQNVGGPRS